eukprot:844612-Prymnesium_polylepis.1
MSFVEAPQAFCYDVMLTDILRKLRVASARRGTETAQTSSREPSARASPSVARAAASSARPPTRRRSRCVLGAASACDTCLVPRGIAALAPQRLAGAPCRITSWHSYPGAQPLHDGERFCARHATQANSAGESNDDQCIPCREESCAARAGTKAGELKRSTARQSRPQGSRQQGARGVHRRFGTARRRRRRASRIVT